MQDDELHRTYLALKLSGGIWDCAVFALSSSHIWIPPAKSRHWWWVLEVLLGSGRDAVGCRIGWCWGGGAWDTRGRNKAHLKETATTIALDSFRLHFPRKGPFIVHQKCWTAPRQPVAVDYTTNNIFFTPQQFILVIIWFYSILFTVYMCVLCLFWG